MVTTVSTNVAFQASGLVAISGGIGFAIGSIFFALIGFACLLLPSKMLLRIWRILAFQMFCDPDPPIWFVRAMGLCSLLAGIAFFVRHVVLR